MLHLRENWVAPLAGDGKDRSHFPELPLWTGIVRITQLIVALVMLVLTAFSASRINSDVHGLGLTWFAFIWTFFYFTWLNLSLFSYPKCYHVFVHIPVEALTNIFWLATWSVLASEATTIAEIEDSVDGLSHSDRVALTCIKAASGVGALEWLLFCITMTYLVLTFFGIGVGIKTPDPEAAREVPPESEPNAQAQEDPENPQEPAIPLQQVPTQSNGAPAGEAAVTRE